MFSPVATSVSLLVLLLVFSIDLLFVVAAVAGAEAEAEAGETGPRTGVDAGAAKTGDISIADEIASELACCDIVISYTSQCVGQSLGAWKIIYQRVAVTLE